MAIRRFTILDAMVLVAAAGIGFWLTRIEIMSVGVLATSSNRDQWYAWLGGLWLVMLGVSLGLAVVRFLPPRPPIRRMARQPGFLALLAVVAIGTVATGLSVVDWYTNRRIFGAGPNVIVISRIMHDYLLAISGPWNVGFPVLFAWIIGGIQRFRWRNADWVEWSGRFLGLLWILCWLGLILLRIIRAI